MAELSLLDKVHHRGNIESVRLTGENARLLVLDAALSLDALNDLFGLLLRAAGNTNISQYVVVLCGFVCCDMRDGTGADNEDIRLHF